MRGEATESLKKHLQGWSPSIITAHCFFSCRQRRLSDEDALEMRRFLLTRFFRIAISPTLNQDTHSLSLSLFLVLPRSLSLWVAAKEGTLTGLSRAKHVL